MNKVIELRGSVDSEEGTASSGLDKLLSILREHERKNKKIREDRSRRNKRVLTDIKRSK